MANDRHQQPALSYVAIAAGVAALGAVAIGALSIGRLAIGRIAARRVRFHTVEIDNLTVRNLRVLNGLTAAQPVHIPPTLEFRPDVEPIDAPPEEAPAPKRKRARKVSPDDASNSEPLNGKKPRRSNS